MSLPCDEDDSGASPSLSPDIESGALHAGKDGLFPAAPPSKLARGFGLAARSFWWASFGVPIADVAGLFVTTLLLTAFLCFPIAIWRSAAIGPGTFVLTSGGTVQTTTAAETLRVLEEHHGNIRSARFDTKGPFRRDNVQMAAFMALPLAFVGWTIFQKGAWLRLWFRLRPKALALGVAGGLLLVVAGFAYQAAITAIGYPPPDMVALLREAFPWSVVIAFGGLAAPLGEEMYFRGRLLDLLDARLGRGGAAILTALAFAALHGIPVLLPIYFVFGLMLAGLRRMSGGLVAPVLAHAINNLLGLLLVS